MADRSSAAEHPKLQKVLGIADIVVFVAATLAIAGVFYEGMTLKWYDIVGIFVICMDYSFMPATILHLVADRKEKTVWLHIFSLIIIIAAVVMKIASLEYPVITLVLWYFYIWFFYGYLLIKRYFVKRQGGHSL
ncbi:MAG: hypothetical protein II936_00845 [Oscillospiraceae bacterium]|nr:hypothetical protein [Oscillospiraceae bacterium]